jgi:hypothetical protein
MTPDLLNRVGQALYGVLWQSALAREVNVAVRTMQRWAAGETPIPPKLREELARLTADRREELGNLYWELTDER